MHCIKKESPDFEMTWGTTRVIVRATTATPAAKKIVFAPYPFKDFFTQML